MITQSMTLKFILALFLTTSTLLSYEIPASNMFWDLYQEDNIIGRNDCSNKAGRYARELHLLGYKNVSVVIILPHRGCIFHAVVEANGVYLDPTKGIVTDKLINFGGFIKRIPIDKLDSLGDNYK